MNLRTVLTILCIALLHSCSSAEDSKEVLFVCAHGAASSTIAAAYFNKIATERNLNYHAVFKGTEPGEAISKSAKRGLTKDDFETEGWKPVKVTSDDIKNAHTIVTFDGVVFSGIVTSADSSAKNTFHWSGVPSIGKDYDKARDFLKGRVVRLIETFPKN